MVLPANDRRYGVHAAGGHARKRHVVVLEVTYSIFFEDHRRCWVLEFGHWRIRVAGFLSFALDCGRCATRPIPCNRPLLAAGKRPDSHDRSPRDEACEPESSCGSDLLGLLRAGFLTKQEGSYRTVWKKCKKLSLRGTTQLWARMRCTKRPPRPMARRWIG